MDPEMVKRVFKAYDIRGRIPSELNEEIVQAVGNAFVQFLSLKKPIKTPIVVGYDVRLSSKPFAEAFIRGVTEAGGSVINIGLVGTDMVYFAVAKHNAAGGVMITASHNPSDYNGLKFVREQVIAISSETGLADIKQIVLENLYRQAKKKGTVITIDVLNDYIAHVLKFIDISKLKKFKVVMNGGNGCASIALKELVKKLPMIEAVPQFWEPDGTFPNGIPNPLLPERRNATATMIKDTKAQLGVAWDGDFDRCFFYDETGEFVEGYYLVQIFGQYFAKKQPKAKIIHDARLTWATMEAVKAVGGIPIACKAGHTFIKDLMRKEDAIYAGEMSAHHYFKDNFYADNGIIPMLVLFAILSETGKPLSALVKNWMTKYPISGEINITVKEQQTILKKIEDFYAPTAKNAIYIDGISLEFDSWRFNLRTSNTEPVIRLNLETRGDQKLMESKRDEILAKIKEFNN